MLREYRRDGENRSHHQAGRHLQQAEKRREPQMPSCLVLESIIQDPVSKGDNHHEDPMILFALTSSRIDSIRASQYLVDLLLLLTYSLLVPMSAEESCNAFYP